MPFYSDALTNLTKLHASKQMESYGLVKYAVLKEYDPQNCIAKVGWYNANTDDYDSLISGWLPIIVPFIGIGDDTGSGGGSPWGIVCPPNIGQPVVVLSQHGDFNNGLVIGGTYSSKSPPPQVDGEYTQDGEFLIMHKKGSYLKFFNSGDVTVHTDHDLIFKVGHDWNVTVENDTIFNLKGNFTRTVQKDETATIQGNQTLTLSGNRTDTISGNDTLTLSGSRNVTISGSDNLELAGGRSENVAGDDSLNVAGVKSENIAGILSIDAAGLISIVSAIEIDILAPIVIVDD